MYSSVSSGVAHLISSPSASPSCVQGGMVTGNLTFYFPIKEHILAVLVQMMIDYQ